MVMGNTTLINTRGESNKIWIGDHEVAELSTLKRGEEKKRRGSRHQISPPLLGRKEERKETASLSSGETELPGYIY